LFETTCDPQHKLLAERRDGYWIVGEHWAAGATRDLAMRRYLGEAERVEYEAKNLRAQRSWLLGRIAVKDAVRDWLYGQGHGPLFPAEVQVSNDAHGRPLVEVTGGLRPRVSLAHTATHAVVAIAVGNEEVGIDLERIEPRTDQMVAMTNTDLEQRLGEALGIDRDLWATTCWTAKEAAGKAKGTALQGRPKDLEVEAVDGDHLLVDGRWVRTTREGDHVVSTVIHR
jgi:phosphopantetheinyl transferase